MSALRAITCGVLAALLVAVVPGVARATPNAVPSPQNWNASKRTLALPGGERIAYLDIGDRRRPALILIHGFTDTSRAWSLIAGDLMKRRRLIIPDVRGHGNSFRPTCCYAYADMARDVIALADGLGIKRFDLAGHSMGSLIAQHVAAGQPRRVATVALLGSTVLTPLPPGGEVHRAIMGVREPLDPARDAFLAEWVKQIEFSPANPAVSDLMRAEILGVPATVWHRLGETFSAGPIDAKLGAIAAPVMTLSGSADSLFGAEHIAALHSALPRATHCVLASGGHNQPYEAPAWTAARMIALLDGKPKFADCR